jgi:hypothetical protein
VVILVVVAVGVILVAIVAVVIHAAVVLILAVVLELWYTTRKKWRRSVQVGAMVVIAW